MSTNTQDAGLARLERALARETDPAKRERLEARIRRRRELLVLMMRRPV